MLLSEPTGSNATTSCHPMRLTLETIVESTAPTRTRSGEPALTETVELTKRKRAGRFVALQINAKERIIQEALLS